MLPPERHTLPHTLETPLISKIKLSFQHRQRQAGRACHQRPGTIRSRRLSRLPPANRTGRLLQLYKSGKREQVAAVKKRSVPESLNGINDVSGKRCGFGVCSGSCVCTNDKAGLGTTLSGAAPSPSLSPSSSKSVANLGSTSALQKCRPHRRQNGRSRGVESEFTQLRFDGTISNQIPQSANPDPNFSPNSNIGSVAPHPRSFGLNRNRNLVSEELLSAEFGPLSPRAPSPPFLDSEPINLGTDLGLLNQHHLNDLSFRSHRSSPSSYSSPSSVAYSSLFSPDRSPNRNRCESLLDLDPISSPSLTAVPTSSSFSKNKLVIDQKEYSVDYLHWPNHTGQHTIPFEQLGIFVDSYPTPPTPPASSVFDPVGSLDFDLVFPIDCDDDSITPTNNTSSPSILTTHIRHKNPITKMAVDPASAMMVDIPSNRNQTGATSSLTAALRNASIADSMIPTINAHHHLMDPSHMSSGMFTSASSAMDISSGSNPSMTSSRPIELRQKPRTESGVANASGGIFGQPPGSFMNGTSWGMSLGSHFPDLVMGGTSPFATMAQSPSLHSSSYLPKMEASFLRDYNCCDLKLDSLHDLIKHYEEQHCQVPNQVLNRNVRHGQQSNNRPPPTPQPVNAFANPSFDQFNTFSTQFGARPGDDLPFSNMEEPLDMEMDDAVPTTSFPTTQMDTSTTGINRFDMGGMGVSGQQFGAGPQPSFRASTINANLSLFPPLQNNPTVSSVNTPTFGPSGFQQPGGEGNNGNAGAGAGKEGTFGPFGPGMGSSGAMSHLNGNRGGGGMGSTAGTATNSAYATATNSVSNSPTIRAAGALLGGLQSSSSGGVANSTNWHNNANALLNRLSGWQLNVTKEMEMTLANQGYTIEHLQYAMVIRQARTDQTLAQKIRDINTSSATLGTLGMIFASEQESKPFKCPVLGCEKTYKNQNGLKYHRQHGHVNQTLQENKDGTFSIVDPETSVPYPGFIGMEKEKPYRCETCGKRYKNLNGLKYHRQHQPMCNPDLKTERVATLEGFFVPPELEALAMSLIPPGSETDFIMAGLNAPAEGGIAPTEMLKNRTAEMVL